MTLVSSSFIDSIPEDRGQRLKHELDFRLTRHPVAGPVRQRLEHSKKLQLDELFDPGAPGRHLLVPYYHYPMAVRADDPPEVDPDWRFMKVRLVAFLNTSKALVPPAPAGWEHLAAGPLTVPLEHLWVQRPREYLSLLDPHEFALKQASIWACLRVKDPSLPKHHNVWAKYAEIRVSRPTTAKRSA